MLIGYEYASKGIAQQIIIFSYALTLWSIDQ